MREESGSITYDEVEERIRFVIREEENGQEIDAFEVIALFLKVQCILSSLLTSLHGIQLQNIEYRYDYRTQQCTSRMIDEPFRPFGVPPNATSYGQFYIGTSGDPEAGMLVNVFGGEFREGEIFTQECYYLQITT